MSKGLADESKINFGSLERRGNNYFYCAKTGKFTGNSVYSLGCEHKDWGYEQDVLHKSKGKRQNRKRLSGCHAPNFFGAVTEFRIHHYQR
jgi:hypothetical protein